MKCCLLNLDLHFGLYYIFNTSVPVANGRNHPLHCTRPRPHNLAEPRNCAKPIDKANAMPPNSGVNMSSSREVPADFIGKHLPVKTPI